MLQTSLLAMGSSPTYSRILHGRGERDFRLLTTEAASKKRKIAMLVGPTETRKMLNVKDGAQMLLAIGYQRSEISDLLAEGESFKLLLFSPSPEIKLANWKNVLDIVTTMFPHLAQTIGQHAPSLKTLSYGQIMQAGVETAGFNPADLCQTRSSSVRLSLPEVRTFLHLQGFRALYTGNGWTISNEGIVEPSQVSSLPLQANNLFDPTEDGENVRFMTNMRHQIVSSTLSPRVKGSLLHMFHRRLGVREYILPNVEISRLGAHEMIDLDVRLES